STGHCLSWHTRSWCSTVANTRDRTKFSCLAAPAVARLPNEPHFLTWMIGDGGARSSRREGHMENNRRLFRYGRALIIALLTLLVPPSPARAQGGAEAQIQVVSQISHAFPILQVGFSANGRYAFSRLSQEIKLWEISSGSLIRTIVSHAHLMEDSQLSADG